LNGEYHKEKWTIVKKILQEDIDILPQVERRDFELAITMLEHNPYTLSERIKKLNPPLQNIYQVYLGNRSYRLLYRVSIDSRKVFLLYIGSRLGATNADTPIPIREKRSIIIVKLIQ